MYLSGILLYKHTALNLVSGASKGHVLVEEERCGDARKVVVANTQAHDHNFG